MSIYYDTRVSNSVRAKNKKLYRISVRNKVPYITYDRKTRVLYRNGNFGGAYINIFGYRVYFT